MKKYGKLLTKISLIVLAVSLFLSQIGRAHV